MHTLQKPRRRLILLRRLAYRHQQMLVSRRVVELYGANTTEVVEVPREEVVAAGVGEGGAGDEFVGLVVEFVVDEVAEEEG